jgi:molybdate transport system permease protein
MSVWHPVWLSLQVAATATLLVTVFGIALAWYLSERRGALADTIASVVALPLVLPPTVIGFALLWALGRGSPLGALAERLLGEPIIFHWLAAVAASSVVAFPLMVESARAGLEAVPVRYRNAARLLGARELVVFLTVSLPLAKRGILAGIVLAFCRALGEFGATLMVAGNIPGRTQTLPLAIYSAVFEGDFQTARLLVLLVTLLGFAGTVTVYFWARRGGRDAWG